MNQDESQLINNLATQLKSMSDARDLQADAYIQTTIGNQEGALYKLVQVALVQHMAIESMQQQLKQLQMQVQQMQQNQQPQQSFLGGLKDKLFGTPNAGFANSNNSMQNPNMMNSPNMGGFNPMGGPQSMPNNFNTSGGSSFLRQALTIGTGVAGGMMLGNALEHLFGGGSGSGAGFAQQPTEIIENNYYGDSANNNMTPPDFNNNGMDNYADNSFDDSNGNDSNSYDDSFDDSSWS